MGFLASAGTRFAAALLLVLGAALLALFAWSATLPWGLASDVRDARSWVPVPAQVVEARMHSSREPRRMGHFAVDLRYRYVYAGRERQGRRIAFTESRGDDADVWNGRWLEAAVAALEQARLEGRPVTVFVDPAAPDRSVVHRDMMWANYVATSALMLVLSIFPLGVLEFALRHRLSPARVRLRAAVFFCVVSAAACAGALVAVLG